MYIQEVNKIALSSNDDKRLQTSDRITAYPYGADEMRPYENVPYIADHPYIMLIVGGSGTGKTNVLLNLIENQPDIDKIYLYAKDPYEAKCQYLIDKREGLGIDHFKDPKAFIQYSNDMHDVYKNIGDYNPDPEN